MEALKTEAAMLEFAARMGRLDSYENAVAPLRARIASISLTPEEARHILVDMDQQGAGFRFDDDWDFNIYQAGVAKLRTRAEEGK